MEEGKRSVQNVATARAGEEQPEFAVIGHKIAEALVKAAEDQFTEAQNLLERTKFLAESIRMQVDEQAIKLADINRRVRGLGDSVLAAHDQFINRK